MSGLPDPAVAERRALEEAYEERFHSDCRAGDVDLSYLRERRLLISVAELDRERNHVLHCAIIEEALRRLDEAQRLSGAIDHSDGGDEVDALGLEIEAELERLLEKARHFSARFHDRERSRSLDLYSFSRTPSEELAAVVTSEPQVVV